MQFSKNGASIAVAMLLTVAYVEAAGLVATNAIIPQHQLDSSLTGLVSNLIDGLGELLGGLLGSSHHSYNPHEGDFHILPYPFPLQNTGVSVGLPGLGNTGVSVGLPSLGNTGVTVGTPTLGGSGISVGSKHSHDSNGIGTTLNGLTGNLGDAVNSIVHGVTSTQSLVPTVNGLGNTISSALGGKTNDAEFVESVLPIRGSPLCAKIFPQLSSTISDTADDLDSLAAQIVNQSSLANFGQSPTLRLQSTLRAAQQSIRAAQTGLYQRNVAFVKQSLATVQRLIGQIARPLNSPKLTQDLLNLNYASSLINSYCS